MWACKTVMLFEGAKQEKNTFYSKACRHALRQSQTVPQDTLIWLGRCAQSNLLHAEARKLIARKSVTGAPAEDGCATTMVIKRLVLQVLSIRRKAEQYGINIKVEAQGRAWNQKLTQI
jgi:hypothetical protein